jgi:hypothetical protein
MGYASVRLVAIAIFAWQSGAAHADCANVNGAVCGAAGNGSMSSINGNVSIAQGPGIYPAVVGKQFGVGARILTGSNASVQANLGAGCFAPIGPSSVAVVTSQKGLTCLSQSGSHWGDYTATDLPPPKPTPYVALATDPQPQFDPILLPLGALAGGTGLVACAAWCFDHGNGNVSP